MPIDLSIHSRDSLGMDRFLDRVSNWQWTAACREFMLALLIVSIALGSSGPVLAAASHGSSLNELSSHGIVICSTAEGGSLKTGGKEAQGQDHGTPFDTGSHDSCTLQFCGHGPALLNHDIALPMPETIAHHVIGCPHHGLKSAATFIHLPPSRGPPVAL